MKWQPFVRNLLFVLAVIVLYVLVMAHSIRAGFKEGFSETQPALVETQQGINESRLKLDEMNRNLDEILRILEERDQRRLEDAEICKNYPDQCSRDAGRQVRL